MARKRHSAEEIVGKLRQVDVLLAQGKPVADAVRAIVACRIFCTSVIETTALALSDPDGAVRA
jgi:hypothetical protein